MERLFKCCFCQQTFLFCSNDQEVFYLKQSAIEPKHCDNCCVIRQNSKAARDNTVNVTCEQCGFQTRVPFSSKGYQSVFCSDCIVTI